MRQIQAALCHEHGAPLTIETVGLRAPLAGEVEVIIDAVAVCHSDISFWQGGFGGSLPAVFGHEAAGRIAAVGAGVQGFEVGDDVVVTLIRACGHCPCCASGQPTICETPVDAANSPLHMADGTPVYQAMDTAAFAERVVVDHSQIAKVPADLPKDIAALLACGVITGVGAAVHAANLTAGQDVVVIGAGGVGLNAIQGARIAGARRIIAIDMSEDKLETALDFGATDGVLATHMKPWKHVQRILGRGADAVLVTVGSAAVYDQAPRYLANGGKVVMVGMPHAGETASYPPLQMAYAGQSLIGSKMGDVVLRRDIPWLVDLYKQGRLKLDELISGRWDFTQINEAIADTLSGAARRNVIMMTSDTTTDRD
ncbi:S-(hydroxymethyl)mycothiol dehydrogenase [Thalassovita autumnalis]|uniref:S-(Hydroxymethyl)mycothiol dehydrogenase n=1 Tax=Thalassovita autumnalis TaxID=2072972 RepID=A0A0N7LUF1_9RHOB|nr:zinc-binding dehydrogenase [Thalassovita autumnalis]CUH63322.1 S-(hydroxymethyl)mycothiol dehydrogenase [Thalassovita autumnalis]CUH71977.1 S-(hydroxymethyl)mycothiol dehydrogenase [Thalassovita autumnalis]